MKLTLVSSSGERREYELVNIRWSVYDREYTAYTDDELECPEWDPETGDPCIGQKGPLSDCGSGPDPSCKIGEGGPISDEWLAYAGLSRDAGIWRHNADSFLVSEPVGAMGSEKDETKPSEPDPYLGWTVGDLRARDAPLAAEETRLRTLLHEVLAKRGDLEVTIQRRQR